ncbi:MAG TPA: AIM24 family protein [Capsulimonadaceae bacterium]|nr:AIM24 family protein [Capsulimonadaceae bacterium]
MPVPVLLPTAASDATYAGVTYHIQGELVPVLSLEIQQMPVYFEHHILLWKDPTIMVGLKPLQGAFKRILAGMPIFMTETQGVGRIAFSRDGAGHVFPIHLNTGQGIEVREHQFLAATSNVDYNFRWVKGVANILVGGTGLFIDTFSCQSGEGVVWLHGYGNVFEVNLGPGEQIDIEPGGWIYKDATVQMDTQFQGLKSSIFASAGRLFWNRFTGPGRVGVQSMSMPAVGATDTGASTAQSAGALGCLMAILKALLRG